MARKYDHEYKVQAVKLAQEIGGTKMCIRDSTKRTHRLCNLGGTIESLAPEVKDLTPVSYTHLTGHFFFTGTVREKIWVTNYYMQWNTQTGVLLVLC